MRLFLKALWQSPGEKAAEEITKPEAGLDLSITPLGIVFAVVFALVIFGAFALMGEGR